MSRFDGSYYLLASSLLLIVAVSPRLTAAQEAPPPTAAQVAPASIAPALAQAVPAPSAEQLSISAPVPNSVPPAPAAGVQVPRVVSPEQLGDSLSVHQRYQAAIAAYSKIAAPSAAVWNKMGIAYQMMYDLKDAVRCYTTSLKLDPHNATVFNNLATVYDSLKQYSNAERLYRKAVKIDPRSALVQRNLGSNQLAQHKYKKGWESYKAALAIDPQIFQSHSGVSVENPASTQDRGAMHYFMARGCVSAGNAECAILNLRLALNEGYANPKKIADDNSFASLREIPAFQQMMAAQTATQ